MAKMLELKDTTFIINSCGGCPMRRYYYDVIDCECGLDDYLTIRELDKIHPKCKLKDVVYND